MSFVNSLRSKAKEAVEIEQERLRCQTLKTNWQRFEGRVLDEAVRVFKGHCLREAELARNRATVSFEHISRELATFPKLIKDDRTYWVDNWGDSSQEEWHYANQGEKHAYVSGVRTPASELLGSMMGRFVDKVGAVGYSECARVPGTWRVAVAWNFDINDDEEISEDSSEDNQDLEDATPQKQSSQMPLMQVDEEEKNDDAAEDKKAEEAVEEHTKEDAMGEKAEGAMEEHKEDATDMQRIEPEAEKNDRTTENEEKGDNNEKANEFEAKASQEGKNSGDASDTTKHDGVGAANGHSVQAVKRPARTGKQRRDKRREAKLNSVDFIRVLQKSTRKAKKSRGQRDCLANNWNSCQDILLLKAADSFKERCEQEAELGKSDAQISFEAISKDLAEFPKRRREGQKYYVDSWGGSTAECWHYATKGVHVDFRDGPVFFSELLEGMLLTFLDKAKALGFPLCKRVPGSWKVSVRWDGDAGGVFDPESAFVKSLRARCQLASKVRRRRMKAAAKYKVWEDQTLETVIDILKQNCKNEAAMRKRSASIGFDVITRDVSGFPTRIKTGGMYLVDSWGTCSAENWFYAKRGVEQAYVATTPVAFPELLESMMPRFIARVSELGLNSCERVPRTWKVAVRWAQDAVPLEEDNSLSFGLAAALRAKLKEAEKATAKRERLACRWKKFEDRLMSKAVKILKERCVKEAESGKRDATISFEVITRDVQGFPKHDKRDGGYIVENWGKSSAEEWFYGTQGINRPFDKSSPPVSSAELLAGMMGRFLEKAADLGFSSCNRVPGTWKVLVQWDTECEDSGTKRAPEAESGDASNLKRHKVNEETIRG